MKIRAYKNINQLLTLNGAFEKDGRHLKPQDSGVINDAAIVFNEEKILWVGHSNEFPAEYEGVQIEDGNGLCFTPEIVDSHTHLIFGGNRSLEYSMRLNGADYQEIAKAGGGILSTMVETNKLNANELFELAKTRVEQIASYGVGTIEVKSGYGLNYEKEKELTLVIDRLKKHFEPSIQILNTYMAAHAIPKEFKTSNEYMDKVVIPLLEELSPLDIIDAVDIFHERGYFDTQDTQKLFIKAKELGINLKSHADEFQDNKGAILAAEFNALSTDHLLRTNEDGIKILAKSNTVATLLPGTGFFLGKDQSQARKFLDNGCKVAIASDYNPGSCHCDNVLLVASLSAPTLKMNMTEVWSAITLNAAHALGLKNQGALVKNLAPRFSKFKVNQISDITYFWGKNFSLNN